MTHNAFTLLPYQETIEAKRAYDNIAGDESPSK